MDIPFKCPFITHKNKRPRARKKGILQSLQKQIEFYFGNVNLQHDSFLMKKIRNDKDGFVLLDLVASFNCIKRMTNDRAMIVKAIQNSSLLQLNGDHTKVRRITPPQKENYDARTVYVERLPHYVNHNWLRDVFQCCGDIQYIRLPRYKNSGDVKGFAFIEYKSEEGAEKACQVLNSIYIKTSSTANELPQYHMDASGCSQKHRKRQRSCSTSSDTEEDFYKSTELPSKRQYTGTDIKKLTSPKGNENSERTSCVEKAQIPRQEIKNCTDDVESGISSKNRRKRKRRRKLREENVMEIPPLYVIHKKEWIRLKAFYKYLQKVDAGNVKKELCKQNDLTVKGVSHFNEDRKAQLDSHTRTENGTNETESGLNGKSNLLKDDLSGLKMHTKMWIMARNPLNKKS